MVLMLAVSDLLQLLDFRNKIGVIRPRRLTKALFEFLYVSVAHRHGDTSKFDRAPNLVLLASLNRTPLIHVPVVSPLSGAVD